MALGTYDTHTLMGVIRTLKPLRTYWLDLLFPSVQTFDTEYIDFDLVDGGRRVAPFVAPSVQGRIMASEGFTTQRFRPAYVKPKSAINPTRTIKRRAGEMLTGGQSPSQRWNAIIADDLRMQRDMIVRRWELMAKEAVLDGQVTVSGEDYPTKVVDFGRDANQTITKTGGNYWGEAGVSIVEDLNGWISQTHEASGFAPNRLTMAPNVWEVFAKDSEVKDLLDTRRGSASQVELGPDTQEGAQFKGTLGANLEVWTYQDYYEDNSGTNQKMMPDSTITLTSAGVEGVRAFGAIMDHEAQFNAVDIFPKMWAEQDPSAMFLMSQSAPLMIPTRPDAVLKAKVLA